MLSQRFSNCLIQLLEYKLNAEIYDNSFPHNNKYQASFTHNILSKICNMPCNNYFSEDATNLHNYVMNNIRNIQNNRTNTFEPYEDSINWGLQYLDFMQEHTQNYLNELINISLDDNFVFDNNFYQRFNNSINNDEKVILLLLIDIHITRLFNNFYYKWLANRGQFIQDIRHIETNFQIKFIPHDIASTYLHKLISYVQQLKNNDIKIFIEYLEQMVNNYRTITSPLHTPNIPNIPVTNLTDAELDTLL